jgi:hypothetical protein
VALVTGVLLQEINVVEMEPLTLAEVVVVEIILMVVVVVLVL